MIPTLFRTSVVGITVVIALAGCSSMSDATPAISQSPSQSSAAPAKVSSPQTHKTGTPTSTPAATTTPATSPTSAPALTSKKKAYNACAAYAATHKAGTLGPFSEAVKATKTNQGVAAFDWTITTPQKTRVYYLCELPGYPTTFSVSTASPHGAS